MLSKTQVSFFSITPSNGLATQIVLLSMLGLQWNYVTNYGAAFIAQLLVENNNINALICMRIKLVLTVPEPLQMRCNTIRLSNIWI